MMLRSGHVQAHINGPEFLLLPLDTCQPTLKVIERLIRSSARVHENTFCQHIAEHLSQETRRQMDALLDTESYLEDEAAQFKQSELNFLKTDPGRLGLKSLLSKIEKLQRLQNVQLPTGLFDQTAPKLLQQYRRRASTEPPRELRRHPAQIRYTLIAAFCWQRQHEIIDTLVELLVGIIHRISVNAERRVERKSIATS